MKSTFLASAIRKCGGNEEKGNLLYTAYGSAGQVPHVDDVCFELQSRQLVQIETEML